MAAFDFVVGGNVMGTLIGIVVGHIYYFSKEIYARKNPAILKYLQAPQFLYEILWFLYILPGVF